jgi:hypothetical protein
VTGTAPDKPYDGTTASGATLSSGGVLLNDVVTFAHSAASFDSPDVATATTVTIPGITDSGADHGNYTLNNTITTAPAVITPAVVNLSGTRVYDADVDAGFGILSSNGTVSGVSGQTLSLSGSGTLLAKNVGTETVSPTGLTLASGTGGSAGQASNYTLVGGIDAVTVTPLGIAVTGTALDKTYDGTTAATVATFGSGGVLPNDVVTFAHTAATFNSPDVAAATTVTIPGITAGGADAGNYTINSTTTAPAVITPAVVNLSGTRVYDAGVDAAAGIFGTGGTLTTGVGAETLTLSGGTTLVGENVGSEGVSTLTGLSLADHGTGGSAGLAGNYTLVGGTDAVTVTPLGITVTGTGTNKVYDGTVTDAVTLAGAGVLAADSLNFADTAAAFADKNVGTAKPVLITGITASGPDAGNYTVNSTATTAANITPATLTVSALPVTVAVGQTPTLTGSVSGFVAGDTLANATDGTLAWVTNAPVHATAGTYAIDGAGLTAGNYAIAEAPGNAVALDVTAAPGGPVVTARVDGMVGLPLGPDAVATPYGVGSDNEQGNNTGNARRHKDPRQGNRHLADFTGRLALTLVDGGVRLPAPP